MKAKKWLTIITLIITALSLVLAFIIGKNSNCITYDISMAIFGGAALVPDQEPVVFVEKQKEKAKAIPGVMQPVLNHRHVPCVSRQKVRRWDTILIAGPR